MKTVFTPDIRRELITRINSLTPASIPLWGKMNVHQMLQHGILVDEMYHGAKLYKRTLLGRILGQWVLKQLSKEEVPYDKNSPTGSGFKGLPVQGDVAAEKEKWSQVINAYAHYPHQDFTHWFFGKMTREQVGHLAYKHIDHHLRQFNV